MLIPKSCQTPNSPGVEARFCPSVSQSEVLNQLGEIQCKNYHLFSFHQNLNSPKNPKAAINLDLSRYSKSYFHLTKAAFPSSKSETETFGFLSILRLQNCTFVSLHRNLHSAHRVIHFILIHLDIETENST